MYILDETTNVASVPKNVKHVKNKIRFEAVLQTADVMNRNKRRYPKKVLNEGINKIGDRLKNGVLIGELDHPLENDPSRQCTVLMKEASHKILELAWDGNKLVGFLETLPTPNGQILKNLAEDGFPIGFSFRGMGDLKAINDGKDRGHEVLGPLHVVTWDGVSYPSHAGANIVKINENTMINMYKAIQESFKIVLDEKTIVERDGLICTKEGFCYLPNDFDKLIQTKAITFKKKYA